MARVVFTQNLQRHVQCPPTEAPGASVREVLDAVFAQYDRARGYDLVFRHAMDIDASGDVIAFGSSTGGLWVTENQGDLWTLISANLPPVYALRFA